MKARKLNSLVKWLNDSVVMQLLHLGFMNAMLSLLHYGNVRSRTWVHVEQNVPLISQVSNKAEFMGGCSGLVLKAQLWKQPHNC